MGSKDVLRNALRPAYLPEMLRKTRQRVTGSGASQRAVASRWCAEVAVDMSAWAIARDGDLWAQSLEFAAAMEDAASVKSRELEALGIQLGGAGSYELLYFLTRWLRPANVLETGVAAGWSTWALLAALGENGSGSLYSSDFPYFRIADPERYIAYLVPPELVAGSSWHLYVKGDRRNLREILQPGRRFGLVHYDSDKSRQGREFFVHRLADHLEEGSWVVMDDINDDLFFRDRAAGRQSVVFAYGGKYLGVFPGTPPD